MRGGAGSSFLGGDGSSFVGGGAGTEKPEEGTVGVGPSSGVRASFDFCRWKENCDLEAVVPAFMAVSDGTRRPRGRFSESKMAIVTDVRSQWLKERE